MDEGLVASNFKKDSACAAAAFLIPIFFILISVSTNSPTRLSFFFLIFYFVSIFFNV